MNSLKVCFYVPKKDALVEIENCPGSADQLPITSLFLADLYQSRKHRMPSPFWLAFDMTDVLRVFYLGRDFGLDEPTLERIRLRVSEYRQSALTKSGFTWNKKPKMFEHLS